ncbi:hypothetical protein ACFSKW_49270 [Nonomuraea mangrovi]|uniref:Uncharacterized protein n=1 Tax=Nonomuraea mangrovi TaxID=2316207 RepID=A0ABW4TCP6_9ACTN
MASPLWLPAESLRLAGRHLLPLAFFYSAGRLVHDLILLVAAYTADVEGPRKYVGFAVMSLAVLATLAAYIAMFRVIRRGEAPDPSGTTAGDVGDDRLRTAIAHTLLPFLVFYGAWGLFAEDVRQYSVLAQELGGVQQIDNLSFDPLLVTGAIAAVTFAVRALLEKWYERGRGAFAGVLTTAFESMWMFFAVISLEVFVSARIEWLTSRAAWAMVSDALGAVLGPLADLVGVVLPRPVEALVLPLVWLTIAAVVYGRDMSREEEIVAGTRVEPTAGAVWRRLPRQIRSAAEFLTGGLRDKYTPMLNGMRYVLSAGARFYLTFCLCYVLLLLAREWTFVGVTRLVGPHESNWWTMWHGPVRFGVTALFEVARISLLAAALHLLGRSREAGLGNDRPGNGGLP